MCVHKNAMKRDINMKTFTIIVTNGNSGFTDFRVHKAGCQDIPLEERKSHGHHWEEDAIDVEAFIKEIMRSLEEDDMNPYPREAFSIAPCVKKALDK